jgi:hypothetical protein
MASRAVLSLSDKMATHSEERRIAGLLHELIVHSGMAVTALESQLGWEPGRLVRLLNEPQSLTFEHLLEILPLVKTTPGEFFSWLYGFEPKAAKSGEDADAFDSTLWSQKSLIDRRFEESRRVVRDALARRSAWKKERAQA